MLRAALVVAKSAASERARLRVSGLLLLVTVVRADGSPRSHRLPACFDHFVSSYSGDLVPVFVSQRLLFPSGKRLPSPPERCHRAGASWRSNASA